MRFLRQEWSGEFHPSFCIIYLLVFFFTFFGADFQPWFVSYKFDYFSLEWWSFELLIVLSGLLPNPQLETSVLSIWYDYKLYLFIYELLSLFTFILKLSNVFLSDQFIYHLNNLYNTRSNWLGSKVFYSDQLKPYKFVHRHLSVQ
jgi:hypothetical protein